ncbi:hypothetical protein GC207_11185 [bacterium]|nr:hypothetical protein [bacterium]
MRGIDAYIEGSRKLTSVFGQWPTFHDAEVCEIHLRRGDINRDPTQWLFPLLTARLRLWELTDQTGADGLLVTRNHRVVTMQFEDLDEDLEMNGFNHQNSLDRLSIERVKLIDSDSFVFKVRFAGSFGLEAQFSCCRIKVDEVSSDCSQE